MVSNNFKELKQVISVVNQKSNTNDNIDNYINCVDKGKEQNCTDEVILFFSFDVVNSTAYKSINYLGWATILNGLFEKIQEVVKGRIPSSELWRVFGDEAVFIVRIKSDEDIFDYVSNVFAVLTELTEELKNGMFFQKLDLYTELDLELLKRQHILSLKGAAWIALVTNIKDKNQISTSENIDNISVAYHIKENYEIFEFLGNDIDAGFRIAKKTCDRRLVISFELAYLLSKKEEYISRLNVITYAKLRGIWNEKLYPIIWYHDSSKCNNISFQESFFYDEIEDDKLVKEYFSNKEKDKRVLKESYMYDNVDKALNKILKDRNLESKINRINDTIKITQDTRCDLINMSQLELHCVAVCYEEKSSKVLIAKRNSQKYSNPEKWEFGCARAVSNDNIKNSILSEYKKDFNIDIELIVDGDRSNSTPVPIAIYELKKSNGLHKGIITIGIIKNDIDTYKTFSSKKHEEVRFIGEDEIDSFNEAAVDDFKQTLKLVFSKIREIKGGGD